MLAQVELSLGGVIAHVLFIVYALNRRRNGVAEQAVGADRGRSSRARRTCATSLCTCGALDSAARRRSTAAFDDTGGVFVSSDFLRGSCLCGAVQYEVRKPFLRFAHCYCGRCRKATGSSHAANVYVEPNQCSWMSGNDMAKRFELPSAQSFATTYCT